MVRWILCLLGCLGVVAAFCLCSEREWVLLLTTLRLVLLVELITLPMATLLAALFARSNVQGQGWWRWGLASLLFLPLYVQLCGWDAAFGVLGWFTLSHVPRREPWLSGFRGAVVVHSAFALPWATWLMLAMFRYGRKEWEEQALLDGSGGQVWRMVTQPQLIGGVLLAAVWIFISTAGEMTVTNIYMVRTYAENVYSHFAGSGDLEAVVPRVGALVVFCVALILFGLATLQSLPANLFSVHAYRWRLRNSRVPATLAVGCMIILLLALPLANLAVQAGMNVRIIDERPQRAWSFVQALQIVALTPPRFAREFFATGELAACVTALSLAIGGGGAWLTRRHSALAAGGWFLAAVGLALPGPIIGMAVIRLLNQPSSPLLLWLYDRTMLPPVLALLVRGVPIAYLGSWWAWRTLDQEILAAAELDGANAWQRFMRIALPQRWSVIVSLGVFIFALASGDIVVSLLTLPPGISTIAQRMFGLLHSGVNDQVAGIGIVIWLSCVLAATTLKFFHVRYQD